MRLAGYFSTSVAIAAWISTPSIARADVILLAPGDRCAATGAMTGDGVQIDSQPICDNRIGEFSANLFFGTGQLTTASASLASNIGEAGVSASALLSAETLDGNCDTLATAAAGNNNVDGATRKVFFQVTAPTPVRIRGTYSLRNNLPTGAGRKGSADAVLLLASSPNGVDIGTWALFKSNTVGSGDAAWPTGVAVDETVVLQPGQYAFWWRATLVSLPAEGSCAATSNTLEFSTSMTFGNVPFITTPVVTTPAPVPALPVFFGWALAGLLPVAARTSMSRQGRKGATKT